MREITFQCKQKVILTIFQQIRIVRWTGEYAFSQSSQLTSLVGNNPIFMTSSGCERTQTHWRQAFFVLNVEKKERKCERDRDRRRASFLVRLIFLSYFSTITAFVQCHRCENRLKILVVHIRNWWMVPRFYYVQFSSVHTKSSQKADNGIVVEERV